MRFLVTGHKNGVGTRTTILTRNETFLKMLVNENLSVWSYFDVFCKKFELLKEFQKFMNIYCEDFVFVYLKTRGRNVSLPGPIIFHFVL